MARTARAHDPVEVDTFKTPSSVDSEGTGRVRPAVRSLEPALVNDSSTTATARQPVRPGEVGRRFEAAKHAFEGSSGGGSRPVGSEIKAGFATSPETAPARDRHPSRSSDTRGVPSATWTRCRDNGPRWSIATTSSRSRRCSDRHYVAHAAEWSGLDAGELLAPLRGSRASRSALTTSCWSRRPYEGSGPSSPRSSGGRAPAKRSLQLRDHPGALGVAVRAYLEAVGMRLAGATTSATRAPSSCPK